MKYIILLISIPLLFSACKKDENGGSTEAEIINFSVTPTDGLAFGQVVLETQDRLIYIFSDGYIEDANFPLSLTPQVDVSPGASVMPASGSQVNFAGKEEFVKYSTLSEDGSTTEDWIAVVRDNQIPNSDFENWHTATGMNGKEFLDPGKYAESTVWATANTGTSLYSVYGTTPIDNGGNTLVKITTGKTSTIPVTSGTLYLGKFNIDGAIQNPTNPTAATNFNIPFTYRPTAIKFMYKYTSGDTLIQGTLNDANNLFGGFTVEKLSGKDEYSIYGTLEARNGDEVEIIADFKLTGSDTQSELAERVIQYNYYSEATPTHITLVFASSAEGNFWKGAVGSTLIVDNLELIYE